MLFPERNWGPAKDARIRARRRVSAACRNPYPLLGVETCPRAFRYEGEARATRLTGVAAKQRSFPERGFCGEAAAVAGPV